MPCRVGETATSAGSGQPSRCIHGLAPNDSFDVRVPWDWSQHPGVLGEGGDYRIKSYEDLLAAWQAQAAKEQAEDEAPVATADEESEATVTTPTASHKQVSSLVNNQQSDETTAPDTPAKDSPIAKQRAQIANFMKRHEQLAARQSLAHHPFATPCGRCRHRLDSSPTKDESVPHCAWAGRLRSVTFKVLQPDDKNAPSVPVCRQFAPNQPWHELIVGHPSPPEMPRDWLKEQILHLVKDANPHGSSRNAFEFLTGRPMGSNENHGDWFSQQLDAQGGDLSDAQLFTLFVWAHAEWQRARNSQFSLPVNGHGIQFATYHEHSWRIEEVA